MPLPTPFDLRTSALCTSHEWRDWSGYRVASQYDAYSHEREYFAIRNSAALLDVSPLFKYEVSGVDAENLLNYIVTRDVSRCEIGQVMYTPWCDMQGKVVDDGTISRLAGDHFRVTSAHPNLRWFQEAGDGYRVAVRDVSEKLAALALQGPKSRDVLARVLNDVDLDALAYYHLAQGRIAGEPVTVTRTGYTGDLGYELWVRPQNAIPIWDALVEAGQDYLLRPAGLAALDMARIEAGLILIEVDYIPAREALIPGQLSSPYELGLGWAVKLNSAPFLGSEALKAEKERGSRWALVGVEIAWSELERIFRHVGLRPTVTGVWASRLPAPLYRDGRQVGQATSHFFSPLLKKYVALATVEAAEAQVGSAIELEMTVEYHRVPAGGVVAPTPFFNPGRKRFTGDVLMQQGTG